jgi:sulfur carrier protein
VESISIQLNGRQRSIPEIGSPATINSLIEALDLKADRIAIEHNGEIVPRTTWSTTSVRSGDKLEIVHFVGGGA